MGGRRFVALGILWIVLSVATLGAGLWRQPQITIQWVTETEVNTAGFNLYRGTGQTGPFEQINPSLILGAGDPLAGADYRFVDENVRPDQDYFYQLEEVQLDGRAEKVELVAVRASGTPWWVYTIVGVGILVGGGLVAKGVRRGAPARVEEDDGRGEAAEPDPAS